MKKKLAMILTVAMLLMITLTSCGGGGGGASSGDGGGGGGGGEKLRITLATGSTSANYYAIGGVMATVLNPVLTQSNIIVSTTGASKANVQLLQSGDANFAIVQNDVSYYAVTGTDLFEADGAYEDFSALCTMYDEVIQIFTLDPDIKSFTDLKGKTVSVGAAGSGDNFAAGQIFAEFGMTFDDVNAVYQSYSDSAEGMKDGKIDAAFCVSGAPTTALVDLAATANKPLNIITIEEEHIEGLMNDYPFYARTVIPAGTYDGQEEDIITVSIRAMLVANNDVSEDVVYELMSAMFGDQLAELQASHGKLAEMTLETATNGVSIPYHPGAVKFFEEQGITVE